MTLTNFPNGVNAGEVLVTDSLVLNGGTVAGAVIVQAVTLSPTAVGPATCAEETFAVTNLGTADVILSVTKPTAQAGLGIAGARVASAGTIGINFVNPTAGTIMPTASQVYEIAILKAGS